MKAEKPLFSKLEKLTLGIAVSGIFFGLVLMASHFIQYMAEYYGSWIYELGINLVEIGVFSLLAFVFLVMVGRGY